MTATRKGIILSSLPGLIMVILFYSLALHMHQGLGAWPNSIGEQGFPASLIAHANITRYFFITLVWFSVFVLPVAILVCLLRPRWQHLVRYFALYALAFCVCWALMQLAPKPFLYWWWD